MHTFSFFPVTNTEFSYYSIWHGCLSIKPGECRVDLMVSIPVASGHSVAPSPPAYEALSSSAAPATKSQ